MMEIVGNNNNGDKIGLKKTKGKQRIQIKWIEDKTRRQVTFSKRREGLFKKCSELGSLHGAQIVIIAFFEVGKLFPYGNPTPDYVLQRYIDDTNGNNNYNRFWWDDVPVDNLGISELKEFKVALEDLRAQVNLRVNEINRDSMGLIVVPNQGFVSNNFDCGGGNNNIINGGSLSGVTDQGSWINHRDNFEFISYGNNNNSNVQGSFNCDGINRALVRFVTNYNPGFVNSNLDSDGNLNAQGLFGGGNHGSYNYDVINCAPMGLVPYNINYGSVLSGEGSDATAGSIGLDDINLSSLDDQGSLDLGNWPMAPQK